jgi:hypothetical protein
VKISELIEKLSIVKNIQGDIYVAVCVPGKTGFSTPYIDILAGIKLEETDQSCVGILAMQIEHVPSETMDLEKFAVDQDQDLLDIPAFLRRNRV